jgi:adenylosuccinate synthase
MSEYNTPKIKIVCGAQFGSEGKGNVAAWLSSHDTLATCVRVGGPNAGHTVVSELGEKFKLQQVPVGALVGAKCIIAAHSEVDLDILYKEIMMLTAAGLPIIDTLMVDVNATVLTKQHSEQEMAGKPHGEAGLTARIGSTGKGVGAARSARIMREAKTIRDVSDSRFDFLVLGGNGNDAVSIPTCNATKEIAKDIENGCSVIIEGTQGWGLGLHTRFYPHTTSSDIRAIDFLAQAGISPWQFDGIDLEVWLVARTFPIRVAGNSGPLPNEITWDELKQKPEFTTVTNKVRRIGKWDGHLVSEAIINNGGFGCPNIKLVLTFLDYVFPSLTNEDDRDRILTLAKPYLKDIEHELRTNITAVGTGPATIVKLKI